MKIGERIHLVGSGRSGLNLTDEYDCHVYLVDGGSEHALIDAGAGRDVSGLLREMEAAGLDPSKVRTLVLTHGHADHAGGAAELRQQLGVRVLASPLVAGAVRAGDEQAISLDVARRAGIYPPEFVFQPCPVDVELSDGMSIPCGDVTIEAVATPGHAAGHLAYVVRRNGSVAAFTGDALFWGGTILLQDTWDCSLKETLRSVERLAALSMDALFPGHGLFAVRDGRREIAKAMAYIARLVPPPQFL